MKRKNVSRITALGLCGTMLLSGAAGLTAHASEEEPLSFKVTTVYFGDQSPENTKIQEEWIKLCEEKLGRKLDITFEYIHTGDYTEKLQVINAGGDLPDSVPLSYYICNDKMSKKQLETFWKGVETLANDVFMNSMSGNFAKSQRKFIEIMQLAYNETSVQYAKVAAEMLLHIIYLKFYNKDLYDIRFYRLNFETANKLMSASTIEEVESISDEAFRSIFLFFNVEGNHGERKTISPLIIKYLEENYKNEIKIDELC